MRKGPRLSLFTLACLLGAFFIVDSSLAWRYISQLTHPPCNPMPVLPPDRETPQEISLLAADGIRLRAWYYPGTLPAGILALGGLEGALGEQLPPVDFLIEAGYSILEMDSRACAQPVGRVSLGAQEALDAVAGLDFLFSQSGIEEVGVFGFSMGGTAAIRLAARDERVSAVAAEGGYFNLGEDIVERQAPVPLLQRVLLYSVAGAYWLQTGYNPWAISPVDDLPRISPRPVLLIYGEHELGSGRGEAQYAAAREPKTLWIVPDGDHGSNYRIAPRQYEARLLAFFEESLLKSSDK